MPQDADRGGLDARKVSDLFAMAKEQELEFGDLDEWPRPAWYAHEELRYRGTEEVFRAAKTALGASDPLERSVAANVLSQLGYSEGGTFVEESVAVLSEAARREDDPDVLQSIAYALGHRASPSGRPVLFSLARHPSEQVRFAVATGLWAAVLKNDEGEDDDPEAVRVLMDLMRDPDEDVRDWATFALGTQLSADSPEIRSALRDRLDDPHEDTREEAVCGLAKRRDQSAFEPLMEYLQSGLTGSGCVDAAGAWADTRFIEVLTRVRDTQPEVASAAEAALQQIREANADPDASGESPLQVTPK